MNKTVKFVGGPMDGKSHKWTASRFVIIPDAKDMIRVWLTRFGETSTLFGEHTYEMKCYVNGGEKTYQLEHAGYRKPTLGPGMIELPLRFY